MDFIVQQSQNKRKRKDWQMLGSCQRAEKIVAHECNGEINCIYGTRNGH